MISQGDSQTTRGRSRSRSRSTSRRVVRRISAVPRGLSYDGTCKFSRTCTLFSTITGTTGWSLGATNYGEVIYTFSPLGMTCWGSNINYDFVGLPNAAEIGSLWDRCKIDKVELSVTSYCTDLAVQTTPVSRTALRIYIGNDVNGPTAGSFGTDLTTQLSSCTLYNIAGDQPVVKWTVRPKFQRLVQYTALSSSTEPASGYVDSTTDIPHYGVRMAIPAVGLTGPNKITVSAKFFFSCKNIK